MAWLGGRRHEGSTARRWRRDESGAVAITVAFAALVMVVIAGAAIDMGIYVLRREQVSAAVDAALTSAVSAAYRTEAEGKSVEQSAAAGSDAGKALYAANTTAAPDVEDKTLTLAVQKKPVRSVPTWIASASVDAGFSTYFLKIIGVKTLPIRVDAASQVSIKKTMEYWEFTLAVDVSQSMGIASTVSDMNKMIGEFGCIFACHERSVPGRQTRMEVARNYLKVDFRIDAVNRAVKTLASSIKASMDGNAKVSLYTFDIWPEQSIPMTSDIDSLSSFAIEMPVYEPTRAAALANTSDGVTNLRALLDMLQEDVAASGDGKSAESPKQAVFLITDGVHDVRSKDDFTIVSSPDGFHHLGTVDPAACQSLKNKGILVAVLYVTYYTPANSGIDGTVEPYISLQPKLSACASSPKLFFQAGESEGIKAALQDMLKAVTGSGNVRLTN